MFAVSSFATYIGGGQYRRLARMSVLLAPWPIMLGLAMLVFDLGWPLYFWRLFTTVELTSPMSIGSRLLTLFVIVSLVYLLLWLPQPLRNLLRLPLRFGDLLHPRRWQPLSHRVVRMGRGVLAAVGFVLSLGVGMYTGVLLGAIPAWPLLEYAHGRPTLLVLRAFLGRSLRAVCGGAGRQAGGTRCHAA